MAPYPVTAATSDSDPGRTRNPTIVEQRPQFQQTGGGHRRNPEKKREASSLDLVESPGNAGGDRHSRTRDTGQHRRQLGETDQDSIGWPTVGDRSIALGQAARYRQHQRR